MPSIRSVAVFCGASPGHDPTYCQAARELGEGLARAGLRLIYGGGRVGLMGAMADAALQAGGRVVGVIPEFLTRSEVAHAGVEELIVTDSMHTRKQRIFMLADAFVSFAGGLGTLDETFEILTWKQLHMHAKPIIVADIAGSADAMLALIESTIRLGFARPDIRALYEVSDSVPGLLDLLATLSRQEQGAATADAGSL